MRETVLEILTEVRPDLDFEKETLLISDEILESFDIVTIVAELSDEFDIIIRAKEMIAENFNSLDAIVKMIERLMGE